MKISILSLFFCFSTKVWSQEITGIIKDKNSQEILPFVTIFSIEEGKTTLSNEDGMFSLNVNKFPVKIIISNLAYRRDTIVFQNSENRTIFLESNPIALNEVTISNLGYKLIAKSVEKSQKQRKTIKNKSGFYRQHIYNDTTLTEIHETFYGIALSSHKIEKYKIHHARYAKIPSDSNNIYMGFSNFSYLILAQKTFFESNVESKSVLFPLRKDVANYYSVFVKQVIEDENSKIAEVYCTPNTSKNYAAFEGSIYIDVNTSEIKQIQGKIKHGLGAEEDLPTFKTSNFVHTFEIHLENGLFSFIKDELVFDAYMKKINNTQKVKITGFLHIYKQEEVVSSKKYKSVDIDKNDLKEIKKTKYDPLFWKNNPIIKRTPLEENAINLFEKQGLMTNTNDN